MGLYTHTRARVLNKGVGEWRNYYYEPFILGADDVHEAFNWDGNIPSMKITSDYAAEQIVGLTVVDAASTMRWYLYAGNEIIGTTSTISANLAGDDAFLYYREADMFSILANTDWLTIGGPGLHFNWNNPEDVDPLDRYAWKIPGLDDSRYKKRFFGGWICYVDIPCKVNEIVYTSKIPMDAKVSDFTLIFNVFGDRLIKSQEDYSATDNFGTSIFLTASHEDATDGRKSHIREHFIDDFDWVIAGPNPTQIVSYDSSRDGTIYIPLETDGFTNMPEYRLKLVNEDLTGDEGIVAANQFVAIMIIPH